MSGIPNIPRQQSADALIRQGDALFERGDFQGALACFDSAITQQPDVVEYAYRLGLAHWRLGQLNAAKKALEQAVHLKPQFGHAHGELARVLLAMGDSDRALVHSRRAVELEPADPMLAVLRASVLEANRQFDAAGDGLEKLLSAGYETTDVALVYARIAARRKHEQKALDFIGRLLQKLPPATTREKSALHFAAASLLDALGRYDEAFSHASSANALRGARYDARQTAGTFQNFIEYFTRDRLARFARPGAATDLPIFIVGMPRSGTSLIEQILASHPQIHGGGELDWIGRTFESAVQRGAHGATPSIHSLDHLSTADLDALAAGYLQPLRALNPSARYITDKMPTNFIYLGLIAMLFPSARVIHCRRDPLDICLSCYMTDFAAGYEFSFSLPTCGHFYRQYERVMQHWKSQLDLKILDVDYERLVGSIESETRRIIEFLDLPWDDACLRFFENQRFVGTASNAQVQKPVYHSSVRRWKNYGKFLDPLRTALDAGLDAPQPPRRS